MFIFNSLKCDLCCVKSLYSLRKFNQFTIYKCNKCGIVSFFPKITKKEIEKNNDDRYNYSSLTEKAYLAKEKDLRKRALKSAKILRFYKEKGLLLDIGCSYGFYLDVFRSQGFKIEGIDPAQKAVHYARNKLKLNVSKSFLNNYKSITKFDFITMVDVIEHFEDPFKQLEKVLSFLLKGGILYIQTPNFDSIISRITNNKWYWLLIPEHQYLFSVKSLAYLVNKYNLEIIKEETWDDREEFIKNILFILHLKDKGKTKYAYFLFYTLINFLFPFISVVSNFTKTGGEISLYARKIK